MKSLPQFLITVTLLLWNSAELTADDIDKSDAVKKKVEAVFRAESNWQASEQYRSLFKAAGASGLDSLKQGPHDGVAIQAAWEQVRLSLSKKESEVVLRPDSEASSRFFGFLEGRGRVKVPEWWSDSVKDSRTTRRDYLTPGLVKELTKDYHAAGLDNIAAPANTSVAKSEKGLQLSVSNETVIIPEDILKKDDSGKFWCQVSALMTAKHCYVAVHDEVGGQYRLHCIDRSNSKRVWTSDVWGSWWGAASGAHFMYVSVVEQDDRIAVFGAAWTGVHAEAFCAKDGKNLFRFSSSY